MNEDVSLQERSPLFMKNGQLLAAEGALSCDKTPLCYQTGGLAAQTTVSSTQTTE